MKSFFLLFTLLFINFNLFANDSDFEKAYSCFKSYPNGDLQSKISFQKLLNKNKSFGFVFSFNQYTTDYSTDLLTQTKKEIFGYTEIQAKKPHEGFDYYVSEKFAMNLETFQYLAASESWELTKEEQFVGLIDLKESSNAYSITIKIFSPTLTHKVIFATNFTCNKL